MYASAGGGHRRTRTCSNKTNSKSDCSNRRTCRPCSPSLRTPAPSTAWPTAASTCSSPRTRRCSRLTSASARCTSWRCQAARSWAEPASRRSRARIRSPASCSACTCAAMRAAAASVKRSFITAHSARFSAISEARASVTRSC